MFFFWKSKKGIQKIVIEKRLSEYAPNIDNTCIISVDQDHVYEIRFHGKPVNILPLINSNKEKITENNKIDEISLSINLPAIKIAKPKNKERNNGINTRAKGIKFLNISSCVRDIEIQ